MNYRKLIAPKSDDLAAESAFQLFGVCTRYPKKLASQVSLNSRQTGVYEVVRGTDQIRIIVLSEIPHEVHNSIWHLFSADPETVRFGARRHRPNTGDSYRMLCQLFEVYKIEGFPMPYTMEQFREEFDNEYLEKIPIEKRLRGLKLDSDDKLVGLSDEELKSLRDRLDRVIRSRNESEPRDADST